MTNAVVETSKDRRYVMLSEFDDPDGFLPVTVSEQRRGGLKQYANRVIHSRQFPFKIVPITVDMYETMKDCGILPVHEHIELLHGVPFWVDRRGPEGYGKPTEIVALTAGQYDQMLKHGILKERAPIELIEGFLVWKDRSAQGEDFMTIGDNHRICTILLQELTDKIKNAGATLAIQVPMLLPNNSVPEPDGYIARGSVRDYSKRKPNKRDVTCVIEVSDSTLSDDRGRKLQNYAKAGIPQYVIINIPCLFIEVFEKPVSTGQYTALSVLGPKDTLSLRVGPKSTVKVSVKSLLP